MDPPKSNNTDGSIKDTQPSSAPATPNSERLDENMPVDHPVDQPMRHTVEARVARAREASLNRDGDMEEFEHTLYSMLEARDVLRQTVSDQKKTKKEIAQSIDHYGVDLESKVTRALHFTMEIKNKLVEKEREWNSVMEHVNVREPEDVKMRYDEIMGALIERNVFIADLKRHCNVKNEQDVFKMITDGQEMGLMRQRMEAAEKKIKDMKVEAAINDRLMKERIRSEPKSKEPESKGGLLKNSMQDFLSARDHKYPAGKTRVQRSKHDVEGWRDEYSMGSGRSGRVSKSTDSSDSEGDSGSESDTSSSSSDSEKEERKRKKKKKKNKGKKSENSKEKRRRERQRRKLIEKLPLPDKYYGNKEGWSLFSEGFKTRFADEDDSVVGMLLKETLRGEAQKEYRSLPKDIEKAGWRKCMKWLKERLFGGTRYTQVDYDRNLRNQFLGNRRVTDVCEEFTHWIDKIYEGEGTRMEKVREEAKKRQLIVLFERTDQYTDLLKMVDQNASYEEMKQHLERNEYARKLEGRCQKCGMTNHRTMECKGRRDYSTMRCHHCNRMGHTASVCIEAGQRPRGQSMGMVQRNPEQNTGPRQATPLTPWDRNRNHGGYGRGNIFNDGTSGGDSNQRQWPRNGSNMAPQKESGNLNQSPRVNVITMKETDDDYVRTRVNVITKKKIIEDNERKVTNESCVTTPGEDSLFLKQIIPENCTIGGVDRKVILDTGSEVSMIDMETWKEMKDIPMKRRTTRGITGAQGAEISVIGTCIAPTMMSNGKTAKVGYYVSAMNIQNPVLGGPALEALGYKLMNNEFEPGGETVKEIEHVSARANAVGMRSTGRNPHDMSYGRDETGIGLAQSQKIDMSDRDDYKEIVGIMMIDKVRMVRKEDYENKLEDWRVNGVQYHRVYEDEVAGKLREKVSNGTMIGDMFRTAKKKGCKYKTYQKYDCHEWYKKYTLEDELPPGREMYI